MTEGEDYRAQGHVALPVLFAPVILRSLYEQMRRDLVARHGSLDGFMAQGPLLSKTAIEVYAAQHPPLMGFLWGLTPRIAAVVGKTLLPSYAYFRAYQQGDVCRVHSDRPACEHSLSLTIAYGDDRPWALSVATEPTDPPMPVIAADFAGQPYRSVAMAPGDGVLYRGVHHRHGRLDPNPNSWSAHLFLHWVEAEGRFADHGFDRAQIARVARQAV